MVIDKLKGTFGQRQSKEGWSRGKGTVVVGNQVLWNPTTSRQGWDQTSLPMNNESSSLRFLETAQPPN